MKAFLILVSLLVITNSSGDHQDTKLEIDKNGNVIGLPEKYHPVKFNLSERYLRINQKEIIFPACFGEFLANSDKNKINLSASWYHSKDVLPYYMNISIGQKSEQYEYSFLVSLETLELIELRKVTRKENYVSYPEVELDKQCLDTYNKNIKDLQ